MRVFLKDLVSMIALIGFTGASLTWMDMASRLV